MLSFPLRKVSAVPYFKTVFFFTAAFMMRNAIHSYVHTRHRNTTCLDRSRRSSIIRASSQTRDLPERHGNPKPKGIVVGGGWAGLGAAHAMTAAGMEVSSMWWGKIRAHWAERITPMESQDDSCPSI
jgi:hypothetical protein